jgi:hypothetical protein
VGCSIGNAAELDSDRQRRVDSLGDYQIAEM